MEPIASNPHHDQHLSVININSTTSATPGDHERLHDSLSLTSRFIIPILAHFHAGYFRISLSLGSQALLWKSLIRPTSNHDTLEPLVHHLFHLHRSFFLFLWSFSLLILAILSLLYLLRCILLPHMVKAEFFHHVRVNYLFAPWISWLLLLQCAPADIVLSSDTGMEPFLDLLWWLLVIPMVGLDIKIYGRWFTTKGDKHKLIAVANPTCQMTIIGNLVGSRAAAQIGSKETAMFMFSLGMVHYVVLFVTLYQSRDTLPAVLKPVFFLFFATPAIASLAWSSIAERFDTLAKMLFFLSLFLFMSLAFRASQFKRAMRKFNVAWWAYPFPMTVLALAATEYAEEVQGSFTNGFMLVLVSLSLLVTVVMLIFTIFKYTTSLLLPNDNQQQDDDGDDDEP